jgi:hypothetical protein
MPPFLWCPGSDGRDAPVTTRDGADVPHFVRNVKEERRRVKKEGKIQTPLFFFSLVCGPHNIFIFYFIN